MSDGLPRWNFFLYYIRINRAQFPLTLTAQYDQKRKQIWNSNKFRIFFNSIDQILMKISHNFHYFFTKILLYLIWVVYYQQLQIAFRRGSATKSEDYGKKKIDNTFLKLLQDLHITLSLSLRSSQKRSLALLSNTRCELCRS